jgi:hypothetical protein
MSIEARLKKLESVAGDGACPACGAGGPPTFGFIDIDKLQAPPTPCPTCGKLPFVFTLAIGDRPIKTYAGIDDGNHPINTYADIDDGDDSSILPPASPGKERVI